MVCFVVGLFSPCNFFSLHFNLWSFYWHIFNSLIFSSVMSNLLMSLSKAFFISKAVFLIRSLFFFIIFLSLHIFVYLAICSCMLSGFSSRTFNVVISHSYFKFLCDNSKTGISEFVFDDYFFSSDLVFPCLLTYFVKFLKPRCNISGNRNWDK